MRPFFLRLLQPEEQTQAEHPEVGPGVPETREEEAPHGQPREVQEHLVQSSEVPIPEGPPNH